MTRRVTHNLASFWLLVAAAIGCSDEDSTTGGSGGTGTAAASGGQSVTVGTGGSGGQSVTVGTGGNGGQTAAVGTGGQSTTGTGGSAACQAASDCTLVSNCCVCMVAVTGTAEPAGCEAIECLVDGCTSLGFSTADISCSNGMCGVAAAAGNCNEADVTCNRVKPSCPTGYLPSVVDSCWGPCVVEYSCLS